MIFANRYYLRKLNLDGSNYTLIKQVRSAPAATELSFCFHVLILTAAPLSGSE